MNDVKNPEGDCVEERLRQVRRKKATSRTIRSLVVTAAVIFVLFQLVFGVAIVDGESMQPTLQQDDVVVFLRIVPQYKTGDIVLVQRPDEAKSIKRIVAQPGQTVDIDTTSKSLLVDGVAENSPFLYTETKKKTGAAYPLSLRETEFFVLGDNRTNSIDSRNFGAVDETLLDGVVLAVFRFGR